jgi:hypothetical protein
MVILIAVVVVKRIYLISLFIQLMKELLSCKQWFGLVLGINTLSVVLSESF